MAESNTEAIRILLATRIREARSKLGMTMVQLAKDAKMSVAYLAEVENAKKIPAVSKLVTLANALKIPYEDLVVPHLSWDEGFTALEPLLSESFSSSSLGLDKYSEARQDAIQMVTRYPRLARSFLKAIKRTAEVHDLDKRAFFYALLNSYTEETGGKYNEDLEGTAENLLEDDKEQGVKGQDAYQYLESIFMDVYHCSVKEVSFEERSALRDYLRSVYIPEKKLLLLNKNLSTPQKAFQVGCEIGYKVLGLSERSLTSPTVGEPQFLHLWHDSQVSYFSGALLMNRHELQGEMEKFFQARKWNLKSFENVYEHFKVTPQMLLYRLSHILPGLFRLKQLHLLRFEYDKIFDRYNLKPRFLNAGSLPFLTPTNTREHYCRRLLAIGLLRRAYKKKIGNGETLIGVQRSKTLHENKQGEREEFLCLTVARSLTLNDEDYTSVTLGFRLDEDSKKIVRFWDDPVIDEVYIGSTCERCPIEFVKPENKIASSNPHQCSDHPPTVQAHIFKAKEKQEKIKEAVEKLLIEERQSK